MNKQKKQLFILLGVLVLFMAAFLGLQAYNDAEANKEEEAEGQEVISMEYSDVEYLQFEYEGQPIDLECVDGTWYVVGDHSRNVKQYRIKPIVNAMACPLVAEDKIENVTDLGIYGLTEPQKEIHVGNDVEQYIIYVGDFNTLTSNYYVYLSSDPATVYSIDSTSVTRLNCSLDDLVEVVEEETTGESGEASAEGSDVTVEGDTTETTE